MKKFLSMMLAAAMLSAVIPCIASADGGTVISITAGPGYQGDVNHNGMTVTPVINVVSGETPAGYKYQWYAQNNSTSQEYILPWETGPSITITSQIPAGWWLNFEATPLDSSGNAIGDTVKSNHYISTYPLKGRTDYPTVTAAQSTAYHDTPAEYTFEVDGVKFILLDRVWSGEFYVMMDNGVGKKMFDTSGDTGKQFDPNSTTNIAYWLNSTASGGFLDGTYLPSLVQSHITEESWTFEGDGDWGGNTRTLKVGLLSYSEYIGYFGRFGLWLSGYNSSDPTGWEGWWLRTLRSNSKVFASFKNGGYTDGSKPMGTLNQVNAKDSNYHARPTFHLSADFFEDVRVSNPGAKVLEVLRECDNTDIEIETGPGYQTDVNHTGMVVTPTIDYIRGPQPAGYRYQWYAQNNSTGQEYILPWETGASITITSQIPSGWWLNFEATPIDSSGNAIGDTVKSNHYISTYPLKGRTDYPTVTAAQSTAYHDTPAEYTFEVDGVKFILLDRVWSGEYYVMMENSVGKVKFDTSGTTGKQFNSSSETNIAYWLNNGFLDGNYLPASVQSHITEESWTFEGDGDWGGNTRTLKVGLLSYSEYIGYFGRFGLWLSSYNSADPTGWEGWWLRTLNSNSKVFASFKNGGYQNGSKPMGTLNQVNANDSNYHARPTFHLSADFFEEVKVDVDTMGEKVRDTIADVHTKAELSPLYSDIEIAEIFGTIKSFNIYDASGNVISDGSNIASGSTIRAKAVVADNGILSPVLQFAVFSSADERFEQVQAMTEAGADTADGMITYQLTFTGVSGKKYGAFLWYSLEDIIPLADAITLSCP